jgi:glycerol uptake operon antiterminator
MISKFPTVLPAISNFKSLKQFIASEHPICILMDFQLAELEEIILELKENKKRVFIHIDLIKGLSSDEFGAIYLIQKLHVDGLISIKPSVINLAKKRNVASIQRIFLKDTLSLNKSLALIEKTEPDFLEILPAISNSVLDHIVNKTKALVICGGLIQTKQEIQSCLDHGAVSVTTSNNTLWS